MIGSAGRVVWREPKVTHSHSKSTLVLHACCKPTRRTTTTTTTTTTITTTPRPISPAARRSKRGGGGGGGGGSSRRRRRKHSFFAGASGFSFSLKSQVAIFAQVQLGQPNMRPPTLSCWVAGRASPRINANAHTQGQDMAAILSGLAAPTDNTYSRLDDSPPPCPDWASSR